MNKLKIGLSYSDHRISEYQEWLKTTKYNVELIDLSYHENNFSDLKNCKGLVLSGGIDINPNIYGKGDKINLCGKNIKDARDKFETTLISIALDCNIPILGICRGMQMVNVSPNFGGTMLCDISTEYLNPPKKIHHSVEGKEGTSHIINIDENTVLKKILNSEKVLVNSFHHQAVEKIGKGLKISSTSEDGIIESLEWEDKKSSPLLLLVQWHPERMTDFSSKSLLEYYYEQL